MSNRKISELTSLTAVAGDDVLPIVDISETSNATKNKKITVSELLRSAPDGTAAAPAFSFESDAGNGVFLAGTDTVGISTGGTQRVTVDGSGNVTISGDLTVSGATTTVESTTVTIDDKNIELGSVASPSNTTADGGGITLKGATDKTLKWINSTGSWTFNQPLRIESGTTNTCATFVSTDAGAAINLTDSHARSTIEQNGTTLSIIADTDASDASSDIRLKVDNSTKLIVDSSGRVGIGTTSPSAPLVFGKSDYGEPTSEDFYRIKFKDFGGIANDVGIGQPNEYSLAFNIEGGSTASYRWYAGTAGERMRIDSNGRVMIGTTTNNGGALTVDSGGAGNVVLRDNGIENHKHNADSSIAINYNGYANGTTQFRDLIIWNGKQQHIATFDGSTSRLGVGTTSPGRKLDVNGIIRSDGTSGGLAFGGNSSTPSEGAAIHRPANNTLAFVTNSSERMRIDSSGKVGIGTTSPSQKLQVTNGNIFLDGTDQFIYLSSDADQWLSANSASNYMRFGAANQERMRIDSSGNVGIGTSSPSAKLDVNGNVQFGDGGGFDMNINGTRHQFSIGGSEKMRIDSSGNVYIGGTSAATADIALNANGDITASGQVNISTAKVPIVATRSGVSNGTAAMVDFANDLGGTEHAACKFFCDGSLGLGLDASNQSFGDGNIFFNGGNGSATFNGNVGIGHTSPASLLTVGGDALTTAKPTVSIAPSSGNGSLTLRGGSPTLSFDITSGGDGTIIYDNSSDLLFKNGTLDSSTERMRIDSSGNVGIGTTTPGDADEGAGLQVQKYVDRNATYYSPDGHYAGSFGHTNNTQDKVWIAVDSSYAQSSAVSAGLFLSAFHQDTGGSGSGATIKNLKSNNSLVFSTVATASSGNNPAVETERLRIHGSGNVGIGTSSPGGKLAIAHTLNSAYATTSRNNTFLQVHNPSTTSGCYAGIEIAAQGVGNDSIAQLTAVDTGSGNTDFVIGLRNSSTFTERMRIGSSGNVGIGLTNPAHQLELGNGDSTIRLNATAGGNAALKFLTNTGNVGQIVFGDTDDDDIGFIQYAHSDNSLKFAVNASERMRILNTGYLQAKGNVSNYHGFAGHQIAANRDDTMLLINNATTSTTAARGGIHIIYNQTTPNNTSFSPLAFDDSSANRFTLRSNGGIANYQSNDANLCDEREKKNIESLDSTWSCLKNWELKKFHYNEDFDTDNKRYGVIAQQVAPYCPELITDWLKQEAADAVLDDDGNVVTPAKEQILRKGVKEQQMMWMAIKALQEAQERIETLEAKVAALEAG